MRSQHRELFTWNGRQLEVVKYGDAEVLYTYDSEGIRTSKTVNGITTTYQHEDTKIVSETIGDEEIASVNPFRYRGYYQDNETGFYYLQSRYYDSETGRFLNADDIMYLGMSVSICSYNLYTYVNNNPVNQVDYMGNYAIEMGVFGTLVVAEIIVLSWKIVKLLTKLLVLVVKLVWNIGKRIIAAAKDIIAVVQQSLNKAIEREKISKTERHHIIAKTASKMESSRDIWVKECKNSIDDNRNLVDVDYNLHKVMHTTLWYTTVDSYIQVAYKEGKEKQVVDSLAAIKLILQVASSCL